MVTTKLLNYLATMLLGNVPKGRDAKICNNAPCEDKKAIAVARCGGSCLSEVPAYWQACHNWHLEYMQGMSPLVRAKEKDDFL